MSVRPAPVAAATPSSSTSRLAEVLKAGQQQLRTGMFSIESGKFVTAPTSELEWHRAFDWAMGHIVPQTPDGEKYTVDVLDKSKGMQKVATIVYDKSQNPGTVTKVCRQIISDEEYDKIKRGEGDFAYEGGKFKCEEHKTPGGLFVLTWGEDEPMNFESKGDVKSMVVTKIGSESIVNIVLSFATTFGAQTAGTSAKYIKLLTIDESDESDESGESDESDSDIDPSAFVFGKTIQEAAEEANNLHPGKSWVVKKTKGRRPVTRVGSVSISASVTFMTIAIGTARIRFRISIDSFKPYAARVFPFTQNEREKEKQLEQGRNIIKTADLVRFGSAKQYGRGNYIVSKTAAASIVAKLPELARVIQASLSIEPINSGAERFAAALPKASEQLAYGVLASAIAAMGRNIREVSCPPGATGRC